MFELAKKVVVILATSVATGGSVYLAHSVVSSYVNSIVVATSAVDDAAAGATAPDSQAKMKTKRSVNIDLSGLFN